MSDDNLGTANQSRQPETIPATEASIAAVPPGGLYVAHAAVTAGAVAGALASKDPRRKAYLRHVIMMAALTVCAGAAIVIALAVLLD